MDGEEKLSDKKDKLHGIHEGLDINTYMGMELIFSAFHSAPNRWPPARSAGSGGRALGFPPRTVTGKKRQARGGRRRGGGTIDCFFS